jgi:hypothetical protein
MAVFPKIDRPCPLGIDEQKRIDGYCGRCDKVVHALNGMSGDERVSLLRSAKGPLCVSYRLPARRVAGAGLGAALALSIVMPAFAKEPTLLGTFGSPPSDPAGEPQFTPAVNSPSTSGDSEKIEFITVTGGVSNPSDANFVDDSKLPDLPIVPDDGTQRR